MDIIALAVRKIIGLRQLDHLFNTGFKYLWHLALKDTQLFGNGLQQASPGAFSKHSHLCQYVDTRLKVRLGGIILANPLVSCTNSDDGGFVLAVEYFFAGKTRKDIDPKILSSFSKPGNKLGQTYDMEPLVVHIFGNKRDLIVACSGQEVEFISTNVFLYRTACFPVVRNKLFKGNRVQNRTAQCMRTYVRPLFDESYLKVKAPMLGQFHQVNCTGKAGRTSTHKQHIKFYLFSDVIHFLST